jgi:hypothetical protein
MLACFQGKMFKMNLQVIKLPQTLSFLLSHEMQLSTATLSFVCSIIEKDPAFTLLIQKSFSEFDSQGRLDCIVKSLGWRHFRDRLVSLYVFRSLYDKYPKTTDLRLVDDLINFEESFKQFSVDSNSRLMLLAFYVRLFEIDFFNQKKESINLLNEFKALYDLLSLKNSKSPKIDFLLLLLWHLKNIFGEEEIKSSIKLGINFQDIADRMSLEQKNTFAANCLSYGASISEYELFIHDRI